MCNRIVGKVARIFECSIAVSSLCQRTLCVVCDSEVGMIQKRCVQVTRERGPLA